MTSREAFTYSDDPRYSDNKIVFILSGQTGKVTPSLYLYHP